MLLHMSLRSHGPPAEGRARPSHIARADVITASGRAQVDAASVPAIIECENFDTG